MTGGCLIAQMYNEIECILPIYSAFHIYDETDDRCNVTHPTSYLKSIRMLIFIGPHFTLIKVYFLTTMYFDSLILFATNT